MGNQYGQAALRCSSSDLSFVAIHFRQLTSQLKLHAATKAMIIDQLKTAAGVPIEYRREYFAGMGGLRYRG